jgi:hypothetical protein
MNVRRNVLNLLRERTKICGGVEGFSLFRGAQNEGDITVRLLRLGSGDLTPREGELVFEAPAMKEIISAAGAQETVENTAKALAASSEIVAALHAEIPEKLGAPVPIEAIAKELAAMAKACASFAGGGAVSATTDETGSEDAAPGAQTPEGDASAPPPGAIADDQEAAEMLDKVIGYFARNAPSSPVALILLKVRELRTASFNDWNEATGSNGPEKVAFDFSSANHGSLGEFAEEKGVVDDSPQPDPTEGLRGIVATLSEQLSGAIATAEENPEITPRLESMLETIENLGQAIDTIPKPAPQTHKATIDTRAAVKTALDQLAAYHDRQDPGCAIQAILRRTKPLVDLKYLDILARLTPNGGKAALSLIQGDP